MLVLLGCGDVALHPGREDCQRGDSLLGHGSLGVFREPGYSKQRRLESRIAVGLLTDARGFPLMVGAFEGNRAETTTIIPSLQAAYRLAVVSVVADAGMLSDGNLRALSGAGLWFIVGQKVPEVPYVV